MKLLQQITHENLSWKSKLKCCRRKTKLKFHAKIENEVLSENSKLLAVNQT